MNLDWQRLTRPQRAALLALRKYGPCDFSADLADQLMVLGLVEELAAGGYCISSLGQTIRTTVH